MSLRTSLFVISILSSGLLFLAGCSSSPSLPPETATAQTERIQKMATQMASAYHATGAVSQQQSTESAIAGVTLLSQASSWPLVISDTFDNNNNQWPIGTKDSDLSTEQLSIDNGKYNWTATAKDGFVYWTTPITETTKDFYLAVDAMQISGPEDGETDLVFHEADTSNFYLFEVSGVKKFSVSQLIQDEWQTRIDWTDSEFIQPLQSNHLVVIGKGKDYYFFINGNLVGTYTETTASQGSSGVAVALYNKGDTGHFAFDNFELRIP
jgi:hypothetical protein